MDFQKGDSINFAPGSLPVDTPFILVNEKYIKMENEARDIDSQEDSESMKREFLNLNASELLVIAANQHIPTLLPRVLEGEPSKNLGDAAQNFVNDILADLFSQRISDIYVNIDDPSELIPEVLILPSLVTKTESLISENPEYQTKQTSEIEKLLSLFHVKPNSFSTDDLLECVNEYSSVLFHIIKYKENNLDCAFETDDGSLLSEYYYLVATFFNKSEIMSLDEHLAHIYKTYKNNENTTLRSISHSLLPIKNQSSHTFAQRQIIVKCASVYDGLQTHEDADIKNYNVRKVLADFHAEIEKQAKLFASIGLQVYCACEGSKYEDDFNFNTLLAKHEEKFTIYPQMDMEINPNTTIEDVLMAIQSKMIEKHNIVVDKKIMGELFAISQILTIVEYDCEDCVIGPYNNLAIGSLYRSYIQMRIQPTWPSGPTFNKIEAVPSWHKEMFRPEDPVFYYPNPRPDHIDSFLFNEDLNSQSLLKTIRESTDIVTQFQAAMQTIQNHFCSLIASLEEYDKLDSSSVKNEDSKNLEYSIRSFKRKILSLVLFKMGFIPLHRFTEYNLQTHYADNPIYQIFPHEPRIKEIKLASKNIEEEMKQKPSYPFFDLADFVTRCKDAKIFDQNMFYANRNTG